jgi:transcriptional regulator with XRE-family HTH domain
MVLQEYPWEWAGMVPGVEASAATLAHNLTRLCKREASIAAVCRGTKINRQQFNRYLAGQTIPSVANRRKICRYFKISEAELFRAPGAARATSDAAASSPRRPPWSHAEVGAVLRLLYSDSRPSIAAGIYTAHFAQLRERGSVVQSTIIVRNDENLTTFRRVTGVTERRGSWWGQFRGDHRGVVIERAHWLYFIGLNARGVLEPSLLVLRWLPGARPMLGGFASINATNGPAPVAAIVNPTDVSLRDAMRAAHAYSVDDPALDPLVLEALEEQARLLASRTARPNLQVSRRSKRPAAL